MFKSKAAQTTETTEADAAVPGAPAPAGDGPNEPTSVSGRFTLPGAAMERVNRLAQLEASDSSAFTSDLSVNEHLLITQMGFEPLGYVMGTSVYHVALQVGSWRQSMELTGLSQAMYEARELALDRMRTEAAALKAEGVVGVRLHIQSHVWGAAELEFVAEGTAIRSTAGSDHESLTLDDGGPFTSDLSGQDFYTLVAGGHFPRAFVLGTCVYHIAHQSLRQTMKQVGNNCEYPQFTEGVYTARELAMTRMQDEANHAGADGIVGVRALIANHVWGEHATEFLATGTAVRKGTRPGMAPPALTITLPISG